MPARMFGRIPGGRRIDQELPQIEVYSGCRRLGLPEEGDALGRRRAAVFGTLGRVDNCQVATSLHLAGERGSGCIGMRLYLPEKWTNDRARCRKAGVPETVKFAPKWQSGSRSSMRPCTRMYGGSRARRFGVR